MSVGRTGKEKNVGRSFESTKAERIGALRWADRRNEGGHGVPPGGGAKSSDRGPRDVLPSRKGFLDLRSSFFPMPTSLTSLSTSQLPSGLDG